MEAFGTIVEIIVGILTIVGMLYVGNRWWRGKKKTALDSGFQHATERMPELIAEMRYDLSKHPLCREFIILSKKWCYNYDPNKKILSYYYEDHDGLNEKVGILENLGFVDDIAFNDVDRYSMSEHFADLLTQ